MFTDFLVLFGIRKNCHSGGGTLLFYIFVKRMIKPTVVIIEEYHC
jgi:hypothetical protein